MDRRHFVVLLGGSLTAAALNRMSLGALSQEPSVERPFHVSADAAEIYSRAVVIDGNGYLPLDKPLKADPYPISPKSLAIAQDSGITGIKASLAGGVGGFEEAVHDAAFLQHVVESYPGHFLQVRSAEDFRRAKSEHKLGILFSFETPSPLGIDLNRIDLFRNLGVRVMQITYNSPSPFGVGCLGADTEGLTDLGRQAIARMNAAGVTLDLSHSNTQTTAEGIATTRKPPIFSHTGCRAVYMHPRSKEDRELKALAEKGGVVGIYMLPFLTAPPKQPSLEDYMAHMIHALTVCGEDHVGVGSDIFMSAFDPSPENLKEYHQYIESRKAAGVSAPGEDRPPYIPDMNTPRKLEIVADALLKKGYSSRAAEKVLGNNWLRVFRETWT